MPEQDVERDETSESCTSTCQTQEMNSPAHSACQEPKDQQKKDAESRKPASEIRHPHKVTTVELELCDARVTSTIDEDLAEGKRIVLEITRMIILISKEWEDESYSCKYPAQEYQKIR